MTTDVCFEGGTCTIAVEGRVDTLTAPTLMQVFQEAEPKADKVIFDMAQTEYISSAGLRVLVAAHKTLQPKGGLVLCGVNKSISSLLNLTGLDKFLTIEAE